MLDGIPVMFPFPDIVLLTSNKVAECLLAAASLAVTI
jgi:hypothetical protein